MYSNPSTPITVSASPCVRSNVPFPVPQSHVPSSAAGVQQNDSVDEEEEEQGVIEPLFSRTGLSVIFTCQSCV